MNTEPEPEFDYQAYMRSLPPRGDGSEQGRIEIHRGPKARQERREAAKARLSQKDHANRTWKIIHEIAEKSANGDYIYRGEPECFPKVSSNLYRQYEQNIETKHFDVEIVQKQILEEAKTFTTETDEFEILTQPDRFHNRLPCGSFLRLRWHLCPKRQDHHARQVPLGQESIPGRTNQKTQTSAKSRHLPKERIRSAT